MVSVFAAGGDTADRKLIDVCVSAVTVIITAETRGAEMF
jgi:hypothetical protein